MKKAVSLLCLFAASIALAVVIFTSVVSYAEEVNSGTWKKNIFWSYDEQSGTLTVSGNGKMQDAALSEYPWEKYSSIAKSIVVSEGVTSVAEYAFSSFHRITSNSIFLPDSLLEIGNGAFARCDGLTSFEIPKSLETFGVYVFSGCTSLETISVSEENQNFCAFDGCLYTKDRSGLVYYPLNKEGEQFTVPPSVTIISHNAFDENPKIRIVIMSHVKEIGFAAFDGCQNLSFCVLGEDLEEVGRWAFRKCSSLKELTFPDSINYIRQGAFGGCSSLERIYFNSPERLIAKNADGTIDDLSDPYIVAELLKDDDSYAIALNKFTIEFYSDNKLIKAIDYIKGDWIDAPAVPALEGYSGRWERYVLGSEPVIKVNAVYTCQHSEKYVEKTNRVEPTEDEVGYTGGEYCTKCGTYISGHEIIPKLEPKKYIIVFQDNDALVAEIEYYKGDSISAPDEPKRDGYFVQWENYTLFSEPVIKVNAVYTCLHFAKYIEKTNRVEPTKDEVGYTEGEYCTKCGTYISGHEIIPKLEPKNTSASVSESNQEHINAQNDFKYFKYLIIIIAIFAIALFSFAIFAYTKKRRNNEQKKENHVVDSEEVDNVIKNRIVRIIVDSRSATGSGMGWIIESDDKKAFIITCRHVFDSIFKKESKNIIEFNNCEASAELLRRDKSNNGDEWKVVGSKKAINIIACSITKDTDEKGTENECLDICVAVIDWSGDSIKKMDRLELVPWEKIKDRRRFFALGMYPQDNRVNSPEYKLSSYKGNKFYSDNKALTYGNSGTPAYDSSGNIIGMYMGGLPHEAMFLKSDIISQEYDELKNLLEKAMRKNSIE